jgi:hypothetical protein
MATLVLSVVADLVNFSMPASGFRNQLKAIKQAGQHGYFCGTADG